SSSLIVWHNPHTTAVDTLSLHDALPISLPNVGQPLSLGARGRPGIEIDGNAELVRGALTQAARQGHAVLHRHIAHGHERHHVRRSEEHTSELQSPDHLVCRLLLEKNKHN